MEEEYRMSNDFDVLVESFVKLETEEKAIQIIKLLKEDIAIFNGIFELNDIQYSPLLNREVLDVEKSDSTMDDYFEAIYVYLKSFEDLLGSYLLYFRNNDIE